MSVGDVRLYMHCIDPLAWLRAVLNIRIWGHMLTCDISYCSIPKKADLGSGGGGGGLYRPLGHYHPLYRHEILLKFLVVHQTPSLITGFDYATGKPLEIAPILKSSYLRTMPTNTEVFLCGL